MTKAPTVYDVAKLAGVSIATVSFTFRQPHKVRESTQEAVRTAARALGYIPSSSARGLAGGRTGALGIFSYYFLLDMSTPRATTASKLRMADVPGGPGGPGEEGLDGESPNDDFRLFPLYLDEVQRGFELECWRRGYALMMGGGSHTGSESAVTDIAGRVDGLAVFPSTVPDDVLTAISRRVPVVQISGPTPDDRVSRVGVDNVAAMRDLAAHLLEVHGLQDLQFVDGPISEDEVRARFNGVRSALRDAGLPQPRTPLAAPDGPRALVADLVARDALPQALMCVNDPEALDLLDALRDAGIDVPGRVAVTGFDGIAAGRVSSPTLTTVQQPMEAMGAAAVDLLIVRIDDPSARPPFRSLPAHVRLRGSCGCR